MGATVLPEATHMSAKELEDRTAEEHGREVCHAPRELVALLVPFGRGWTWKDKLSCIDDAVPLPFQLP